MAALTACFPALFDSTYYLRMPMYRVRTVFTGLAGAPYLNTLFFDVAGGTAAQAVADAAGFWLGVQSSMDSELSWATETEVATINEATGALTAVTAVGSSSGVGGVVGPVLPTANQGLVRWSTASFVDGRRVRGRTNVPGITELGVDNGRLTAATITDIQTPADALIAGATSTFVIWNRPRKADPTAVPPITARVGTMAPVTGASVWNELAILRSRRD